MRDKDMVEQTKPVLTIDIGGTKLAAAVMLADHTLQNRQETPTLAPEGAEAILSRVIALAGQVMAAYHSASGRSRPIEAVGVASAGQIDASLGQVVFATENLPGWTGLKLGEALSLALNLPTFIENDVNCFALAESVLGAGRGYRHLLLVAMGTGVGGGLVIDGEIYGGRAGQAGEVGHFCLQPVDGRPCTCGLFGCLEAYTATRVILAQSNFPSLQALAEAYRAGTEIQAVDEAATWLGWGLASLTHILGPEVIIISGSVEVLGERYMRLVKQAFSTKAMVSYRDTLLLTSELGADAGLLGAGFVAQRGLK